MQRCAGDELVVLLGQPPAGAEERALDGRGGSCPCGRRSRGRRGPRARAARGSRGATSDRPPNAPHRWSSSCLAATASSGVGSERDEARRGRPGARPSSASQRDLLGALGAAELVDAGVLGDLVDPRLERDRPLGLAHAAQRRDEDLLRDVLGAAVVLDHAEHVGVDAPLVALVERLEGAVVAAPDGRDEALVAGPSAAPAPASTGAVQRRHSFPYPRRSSLLRNDDRARRARPRQRGPRNTSVQLAGSPACLRT